MRLKREVSELIADLKSSLNLDYEKYVDALVELIDDTIYSGIWDCELESDGDLPKLVIVQEDEYDNYSENENSEYKSLPDNFGLYSFGYVFLVKD